MIEAGECDHITPEELAILSEIIHRPQSASCDEAIRHVGISRTKFYQLGGHKLGKKKKGFKELVYYLSDLDKFKNDLKDAEKTRT